MKLLDLMRQTLFKAVLKYKEPPGVPPGGSLIFAEAHQLGRDYFNISCDLIHRRIRVGYELEIYQRGVQVGMTQPELDRVDLDALG